MPRPRLILASLLRASDAFGRDPGGQFVAAVRPLLEAHCMGRHGPDVQKAGLRLDALFADLDDRAAAATRVRVHDTLVSGEMPPKTCDRPPAAAVSTAVGALGQDLHAASLARQWTEGRAILRRLNNTEYENTVRELVGTNVHLKDLLPEENRSAGFDNVGTAIELSPTHLLRYQEAAERAIASAIPPHPPIPFKDRRTGREMSDKGPNFRQTLGRNCRLEGDALLVYTKLPRYGLCATAPVPAEGRYRVRMSIAAVGAENTSVPVAFGTVDQGRDPPVVRDVPPGQPTVIELEVDLARRQAFVVSLLTTWDIRGFKKSIEEYTGPGFRIDWLEIDGPVGPFPPASYEKLFAGVP